MTIVLSVLRWLFAVALIAALGVLGVFGERLYRSLPVLSGERSVPGLDGTVSVLRDDAGVVTIEAINRRDAARALGFIHGQERVFQMDLLRRRGAGELAALLGRSLVTVDAQIRVHRFRDRAERTLAQLPDAHRHLLEAYSDGVNAGLEALGRAPVEYLLLRQAPEPWRAEDSLLVIYAMYLQLQGDEALLDRQRGLVMAHLPPALAEFLLPDGSAWDSPLLGDRKPGPTIPPAHEVNLRAGVRLAAGFTQRPSADNAASPWSLGEDRPMPGSNSMALAGWRTVHGDAALVANDMHLSLAVPNVWFRVSMNYTSASGEPVVLHGFSLPGNPLMVVGSNTKIAWTLTNSYVDGSDLVIVAPASADAGHYQTPEGPQPVRRIEEVIEVAGGRDTPLELRETRWGPIVDTFAVGPDAEQSLARRWVAHTDEAVNLAWIGLETARSVDEALEVARESRLPHVNLVVGDAHGDIAWTVVGALPKRVHADGRIPLPWHTGEAGWRGWRAAHETPELRNPPTGQLATANQRLVDGEALTRLGDGGYDIGARGEHINTEMARLPAASERDLLALQLDDRARFLERWWNLLLNDVLTGDALAGHPERRRLRALLSKSERRAAVDSVGYRLVRTYRLLLVERVAHALTEPVRAVEPEFQVMQLPRLEATVWSLIEARPQHLLPPELGATWERLLLDTVDQTLAYFESQDGALEEQTWGRRNTLRMAHPFSRMLPGLGWLLDMPGEPLPGDSHLPRVQTPSFGASQRLVVAPGREADGIAHMPAGQSGHPLSPHYRSGHAAWAAGEATPLVPGKPAHRLVLIPRGPTGGP